MDDNKLTPYSYSSRPGLHCYLLSYTAYCRLAGLEGFAVKEFGFCINLQIEMYKLGNSFLSMSYLWGLQPNEFWSIHTKELLEPAQGTTSAGI